MTNKLINFIIKLVGTYGYEVSYEPSNTIFEIAWLAEDTANNDEFKEMLNHSIKRLGGLYFNELEEENLESFGVKVYYITPLREGIVKLTLKIPTETGRKLETLNNDCRELYKLLVLRGDDVNNAKNEIEKFAASEWYNMMNPFNDESFHEPIV